MIIYTGNGDRMLGQSGCITLAHKRGKVGIMDDIDSGGVKILTKAMLDWSLLSDYFVDEEETLG